MKEVKMHQFNDQHFAMEFTKSEIEVVRNGNDIYITIENRGEKTQFHFDPNQFKQFINRCKKIIGE